MIINDKAGNTSRSVASTVIYVELNILPWFYLIELSKLFLIRFNDIFVVLLYAYKQFIYNYYLMRSKSN